MDASDLIIVTVIIILLAGLFYMMRVPDPVKDNPVQAAA